MSKENNGGPAFPERYNYETAQQMAEPGMTLRDYFAAKAMQTFLRDAVLPTKEDRQEHLPPVAEVAYEVADAMLKVREE